MFTTLAPGDTVQVADREATGPDAKSGLFYNHYRGLTGAVSKVYPDGSAAITVDVESLPEPMRARHLAGSEAQRQKWLDGLSDEARNRLSGAEKRFSLRYTLLVATSDLTKINRKSSTDLDEAETQHLEERRQRKG